MADGPIKSRTETSTMTFSSFSADNWTPQAFPDGETKMGPYFSVSCQPSDNLPLGAGPVEYSDPAKTGGISAASETTPVIPIRESCLF